MTIYIHLNLRSLLGINNTFKFINIENLKYNKILKYYNFIEVLREQIFIEQKLLRSNYKLLLVINLVYISRFKE